METNPINISSLMSILYVIDEKLTKVKDKISYQILEMHKTESIIQQFQECLCQQEAALKKLHENKKLILNDRKRLLKAIRDLSNETDDEMDITLPKICDKIPKLVNKSINKDDYIVSRNDKNYKFEIVNKSNDQATKLNNEIVSMSDKIPKSMGRAIDKENKKSEIECQMIDLKSKKNKNLKKETRKKRKSHTVENDGIINVLEGDITKGISQATSGNNKDYIEDPITPKNIKDTRKDKATVEDNVSKGIDQSLPLGGKRAKRKDSITLEDNRVKKETPITSGNNKNQAITEDYNAERTDKIIIRNIKAQSKDQTTVEDRISKRKDQISLENKRTKSKDSITAEHYKDQTISDINIAKSFDQTVVGDNKSKRKSALTTENNIDLETLETNVAKSIDQTFVVDNKSKRKFSIATENNKDKNTSENNIEEIIDPITNCGSGIIRKNQLTVVDNITDRKDECVARKTAVTNPITNNDKVNIIYGKELVFHCITADETLNIDDVQTTFMYRYPEMKHTRINLPETEKTIPTLVVSVNRDLVINRIVHYQNVLYFCGSKGFLMKYNGKEKFMYETPPSENILDIIFVNNHIIAFSDSMVMHYSLNSATIIKKHTFSSQITEITRYGVNISFTAKSGEIWKFDPTSTEVDLIVQLKYFQTKQSIHINGILIVLLTNGRILTKSGDILKELSGLGFCTEIGLLQSQRFYAVCDTKLLILSHYCALLQIIQMQSKIKLVTSSCNKLAIVDCHHRLTTYDIKANFYVVASEKELSIKENITSISLKLDKELFLSVTGSIYKICLS